MTTTCQPIFLIGAARSGTKMLRDVIASHPAIDRVPYDINFIWRLGNESVTHDELTPDHATPRIARKIQKKLSAYKREASFLIEKTVSNSLRVPFVEAIFPDAKYIFLFRDGRDVVESSYRQWNAPPDWNYLLEKALAFPLLDAPGYALRYVANLLQKGCPAVHGAATWGPRYKGIDQDVATKDLIEVCAIQWARCVEKAYLSLQALGPAKALKIKYEDFVSRPQPHLIKIADFIGIDPHPYCNEGVISRICTNRIGKGWHRLSSEQQKQAIHVLRAPLSLLGYGDSPSGQAWARTHEVPGKTFCQS